MERIHNIIKAKFEEFKINEPEAAKLAKYGAFYPGDAESDDEVYFYDAEFNIFYEYSDKPGFWEFTDYENLEQFSANGATVLELV